MLLKHIYAIMVALPSGKSAKDKYINSKFMLE